MSEQNGHVRSVGVGYARRGYRVVLNHRPLPTGGCSCRRADCDQWGKHPRGGAGWPDRASSDPEAVGRQFDAAPESNVGIHLTDGLVDIDFDHAEAARAAAVLMSPTGMIAGRDSAPASHRFYRCPGLSARDFADPVMLAAGPGKRANLIEVRVNGQTVAPPSRHKTGEVYRWDADGEPAAVNAAVLEGAVRETAAAALLGKYLSVEGPRHKAALHLGGWLARNAWSADRIERFVLAITAAAHDPAPDNRVEAALDSKAKHDAGEHTTGLPKLVEVLGPVGELVTRAVAEWLGLRTSRPSEASRVVQGRKVRYVPAAPYVPFPTPCLPPPWDTFVRQGAVALRCDEALVALPLLAVLAAAVGNTRRVHLGSEWFEPAVLWTCVVAESGGRKSPAADLAINMVKDRQKRLVKEFKDDLAVYKREAAEHKRQAREKGEAAGDGPEKPTLKRVMVSDVTIEKLAGLIDDNRRGLLGYRDELAGWLGSFTRYKGTGGGSDEPNWLSMHRADAIIYDRKTGDKTSVFVPHAAVSIAGGIQPGTLARLASQNLFDSGMVARIIFAMPPRTPKTWTDAEIDPAVKAAAAANLDALYGLAGEADEDGDPRPAVVKLSREARERLKGFVNEWGLKQYDAEGDRAAALAKLEALPGRFALIHHLVLKAGTLEDTDPIGVESLEAGIRLAEWCANETDRVYSLLGESAEEKEVRRLVELVERRAGRHGGRVTVAELQRSNTRKYRTSDDARADLEKLVGYGLGRWEQGPTPDRGGRVPEWFIPESRSCTTHNDSYDRPDDEGTGDEGGPHNDRPGPSDDPTTPPTGGTATTPDESEGCVKLDGVAADRSYETLCVVQDRESENDPPAVVRTERPIVVQTPAVVVRDGYSLVRDPAAVGYVVAALEDTGGPVGLDVETTGLNTITDRVRLLQLATERDTFLIDLFALPDPKADLAPLFEVLADREVIGHNLQFDLRMLAALGFTPGKVFDTMWASRVGRAGERTLANGRLKHGLAEVVARELEKTLDKTEQTGDWGRPVLTPGQLKYAARDAAILLPLAVALRKRLRDYGQTAVGDIEMRALPGVAWAQPIRVDVPAWKALAATAEATIARLREQMDALAPNTTCLPGAEARNWNSVEDVRAAFRAVGVKLDRTDDDALAAVDHPLAALLREHRGAAKLAGTYGKKWVKKYATTGRVLPSWNQLGADSGRMSCSDPNLQQIPRGSDYRKCFVAAPGNVLVKADYSQIELRIAAKITDERVMIDAYRDGRDLHTLTASLILGKAEVTKADRQLAKAINFGLLFGMGARALRGYALANYGVRLSMEDATAYRAAFFRQYPGLAKWHKQVETEVRQSARSRQGHLTRTLAGRRRTIPSTKKNASGTEYTNRTEALNTPVQGTGSDGLKAAVALLWETRAECPAALPVLFCHDEIVVETPEADAARTADWLRRCMVGGMAPLIDPVPVEVEVSIGRTWGG